ncbi:MAG: 1-(5-phosphoribosyl)-5-[(5-phosphoribosylamino)methylideneamino]imidazole-4-carboxamide isomerase [Armatimonadetes bacterium]|nr:1-(5-phosphoribosyl)-5-[(5-phosphoribosylamino)methylideneamino]imidazole-4-carboxamide isomerase [Armatimonadota bacterium]
MRIYPAIDLSEGQVVRLHRGEMSAKTVYSDNPAEFARKWAEAGAEYVHVVDLDGSFAGQPRNLEAVRAIVAASGLPVQIGGGVRDLFTIETYLHAGVARVILGTSAVRDRAFTEAALVRFGEQLVIDIGARDGRVAVQGWAEETNLGAVDFALTMQAAGAQRIVFTDVHSDGTLQGPNLAAQREMATALDIPLIASGGITRIEDVRAIAELASLGVEGLIIGRALYEGTVDLVEAIAVAQAAGPPSST